MNGPDFYLIQSLQARKRRAFTLVEVSIALGLVGFAMVGIMGALPLAMNSGRQSIEQSRAASMAGTIFASFRAQPFTQVRYVDEQFVYAANKDVTLVDQPKPDLLNLSTVTGSNTVKFYAAIVDLKFDPSSSTQTVIINPDSRTLHFTASKQPDSGYQIVLHFANQPDGMLKTGMANRVEITITALGNPRDAYRFSSVIANRQG
jgi:uncharacterized protein (TIGR02598 family)